MNPTRMQSILDNAVASGAVAGVAAAVTGPDGTLFEGCAGTTIAGGEMAVTPQTRFWIASMTKPITSIAAMQLVERGKLALDKPLDELLPALKNPQILENKALRPARTRITLRHLLTHTSGFSYSFASAELAAYIAAHDLPSAPGLRASLNMPLLAEPGTRWIYGISTDWVGLAVEAASGLSLEDYFQAHIFAPLGMTHTGFLPPVGGRAAVHRRAPDGGLRPDPLEPVRVPEFFSGGGGLYSTLADYQKFLRMILQRGAGIVSPATIAEMSRNQIGDLRAGMIPSANPDILAAMEPDPGMEPKWSLGFLLNPQPGRFGRGAGSLAWAGIANTYFWVDPAAALGAVILMQVLPAGDPAVMKTYFSFESAIYAAPRSPPITR
jgi:CubicO group peptidase (beta-lactamase class C family)